MGKNFNQVKCIVNYKVDEKESTSIIKVPNRIVRLGIEKVKKFAFSKSYSHSEKLDYPKEINYTIIGMDLEDNINSIINNNGGESINAEA